MSDSRSMPCISTFSQAPLEMELRYVRPYDGRARRSESPRQDDSTQKIIRPISGTTNNREISQSMVRAGDRDRRVRLKLYVDAPAVDVGAR